MIARRSNLAIAFTFAVASLASSGCTSTRHASYLPRSMGTPAAARAVIADADDVEVLLDQVPQRPFAVVGDLQVRTLSNPTSIAAMQARAAREGLDGIYWIDCTSTCSGVCTAKGFVYLDVAPAWNAQPDREIASR